MCVVCTNKLDMCATTVERRVVWYGKLRKDIIIIEDKDLKDFA